MFVTNHRICSLSANLFAALLTPQYLIQKKRISLNIKIFFSCFIHYQPKYRPFAFFRNDVHGNMV